MNLLVTHFMQIRRRELSFMTSLFHCCCEGELQRADKHIVPPVNPPDFILLLPSAICSSFIDKKYESVKLIKSRSIHQASRGWLKVENFCGLSRLLVVSKNL